MYDTDLLGLSELLGPIILIMIIGGIVLTILGLLYAIRSWMAQSAAFQTRKDVAEIKRILQDMNRPIAAPTPTVKDDSITVGPKIADNSTGA